LIAKNVNLCSVHSETLDWGLCLEDNEKNLYQMERYYSHSYPSRLIENGAVVKFERVDCSISKNIDERDRDVWSLSDLEAFIKKYGLESKVSLDKQIDEAVEQKTEKEHLEDLVDLPAQHKQNSEATRKVMDFITDER